MEVGMGGWKALVVVAGLTTEAAAATLSVTRVDRARPGWVRIEVRYAAERTPEFRLVPTGGCDPFRESVASSVRVAPKHRRAKLQTRDDFAWLVSDDGPCRPTGLSVEMIEGRKVVASAGVPLALPASQRRFVVPPPLPSPGRTPPRLRLAGQKDRAPQTRMSQASLTWSLSNSFALHLSYERTAFAPTMAKDHDDGVMTGLKVRF